MKFLAMSRQVVLETNRQVVTQLHRCHSITGSASSLIRSTAAMIQQRNYYSIINCSGDFMMRESTYFESNPTFRTSTTRWISFFSPTNIMLEKIVVKVPTMGDSITEVSR